MQLINNASSEKLRGGYYTPNSIATFILKWGINNSTDADILEPSCGDGAFLEALKTSGKKYNSVTAIEFDETEVRKAAAINVGEVIHNDFHAFCRDTQKRFNLIVGNPPFIRYQYYNAEQQTIATELFKKAGLKFSKLTNAWVTFIVGSSLLLQDEGKIGFVVPAELLQVGYAEQLRKFLAKFYNRINIISFKKLVFEGIQQEVILLLCERNKSEEHLIDHIEINNADDLKELDVNHLKRPTKKIDFKSSKWTYYFLSQEEIDFLEWIKKKDIPTISSYANVEVGITTGANNFFTVPQSVVYMYQLDEFAFPMVGRSVQVASSIFTTADWQANQIKNAKSNLLVFTPGIKETGNEGVKAYIHNGETDGINKGYKTGLRDDWYVLPSIKTSNALFLRRNYLYPKLILNEAKAYTTDTMHRVFIHERINHEAFVASFYNSMSLAFSEILGRSYGGGVLELMPGEAAMIPLPYAESNASLLSTIDTMLRCQDDITDILKITDEIILRQGLGMTKHQVDIAQSIWRKLSDRRLNRSSSVLKQKKTTKPYPLDSQSKSWKQLSLFEPQAIYLHKLDNTLLIGSCRQGTKNWITSQLMYNYPITDEELKKHPQLLKVRHIVVTHKKSLVGYYQVMDIRIVDKTWLGNNGYPVKSSKHRSGTKYILYFLNETNEEMPEIDRNNCNLILGKGQNYTHII